MYREREGKRNNHILTTSCIILAGGKGLRLGKDKVLEIFGNKFLLEQVISRISPLCNDIILVIAAQQTIPQLTGYQKLKIVTDVLPNKGPLGGIYTGLAASDSLYNLVVAGDMPFLNQNLLRYLLQLANDFDLVVPRVDKLVEPLHAVYSKKCLPTIKNMIEHGRLSVSVLLGMVKVRYVGAEEIDRFDPGHLSFFNINTRADLERARELARGEFEP